MSYASVTKPSVGDPIKLSTIEAIIDNQAFFQSSIGANAGFNADGSFESPGASGSEPALGWTESAGNALTITRESSSAEPNAHGQYCLKFAGSFGQTGGIETAIFPVDELENYVISAVHSVDDAGDKFEIQFITYERDGATSVHTVSNPMFTNVVTGNEGFNDTASAKYDWVVSPGANARFAKIKIIFTVNSSVASAGYLDHVQIYTHRAAAVFKQPLFWGSTGGAAASPANTVEFYAPLRCRTYAYFYNETKKLITAVSLAAASSPTVTITSSTAGVMGTATANTATGFRQISWYSEIWYESSVGIGHQETAELVDSESGLLDTVVTATAGGISRPDVSLVLIYVPENL